MIYALIPTPAIEEDLRRWVLCEVFCFTCSVERPVHERHEDIRRCRMTDFETAILYQPNVTGLRYLRQGREPVVLVAGGEQFFRDPFTKHLCHEIRAVWNRYAITTRAVAREFDRVSVEGGSMIIGIWGPSQARNAPDERFPKQVRVLVDQDEYEYRTKYLTPRYALQRLGSEWGRDCYEDVWADIAIRDAKKILGPDRGVYGYDPVRGVDVKMVGPVGGVVIPDCRFENELKAIRRGGGVLVRIRRRGAGLQGAAGAHGSETEQQSIPDEFFDFVIRNDGTLEDLKHEADKLVRYWLKFRKEQT